MTKKKTSQKSSKDKKINALSSIVTWVGDPSHLNKPEGSGDDESSDDLSEEELETRKERDEDLELEEKSDNSEEESNENILLADSDSDSDSDDHYEFDNESEEPSESPTSLNSETGDNSEDDDSDSNSEVEESNQVLADSLPNTNSNEGSDEDSDEANHEINEQLDRISKLIHHQAELNPSEDLFIQGASFDPERELALQIAEDIALEQSIASDAEQNTLESALNFSKDETPLDLAEIQSCIEALLFISDKPLSVVKLKELLAPELDRELFQEAVLGLCEKYQQVAHGIEIVEIAGGYQFRTKPGRASLAQKLAKVQTQRLSSGGMESLAIIAYRQPVMKEDIDKVRGVDSSYFIRGLMDKKLIKISGRSELPGRPILYNTTQEFLELFGLRDLASLPSLRELEQMIPNSQSSNPEDEDPRIRTMRRLVGEMNVDGLGALKYDPKEDEKLLKEFRERITAIPSSTPYLDEMKAAELLAKQQLALQPQQQEEGQGLGQPLVIKE